VNALSLFIEVRIKFANDYPGMNWVFTVKLLEMQAIQRHDRSVSLNRKAQHTSASETD